MKTVGKKIIFYVTVLLAFLCFLMTVNAEETTNENGIVVSDSDEFGTVNIIEGYDYSSKLSLNERMVLDNGDGTYSTYPSAYALDYNKDGSKRGERFQYFDPSILNDETGFTYSHASVIRYEFPEGITIIHHDDRSNININTCDSMIEVVLPSTLVTYTKGDLFNGCEALAKIDMSKCVSLKTMAGSCFANCPLLTQVSLAPNLTSIPTSAFYACTSLTSVELPSSVTSIGQQGFYGCTALDSIELPQTVTSLGNKCFQNCKALVSVTIPSGVTAIPNDAFHSCTALTTVTMGDSVTSIGGYAFNGCSLLSSINLPDTITTIGAYSFGGCAITEFDAPSSLTTIGNSAFRSCPITGLTLPDTVTSIGEQTFYQCSSLSQVTLSSNLLSLGKEAFGFCSSLTEIAIPDSVTTLGNHTFNNCTALKTVTVSENSQLSGTLTGTFNACSSLTEIYIPSGITSLNYDTFSACSSLAKITLENGLTSITGGNNFKNCTSLTEIVFPNSLTSIADGNFGGCSKLEMISFGDSLTSLGAGNLTLKALKRVYLPNTVTTVGAHLLGYTNASDSSSNITFIFTGTFSQAQALRALVAEDTANSANASKLYDATLVSADEYDVTQEPSGFHFVYGYSKCDAFYTSHTLASHNDCVDVCNRCLHFYAVSSPVHNFEGGETIIYEDFAKNGIKTVVCQNEGCLSNDGTSQQVDPIFTFIGYSIYEVGSSFCVDYTVNIDALLAYESATNSTLDYGMVGAYVGYLNGGTPLDPDTAQPVDISSTGKRIYYHSIRSHEMMNTTIRLTNIQESQYEEKFYITLYIFDGKQVKYLTSDSTTLIPDPVSYAEVRGPIEATVGSMVYSTEEETTPSADRIKQQNASNEAFNTGSSLSSSELEGSGWFDKGIVGKAKTVVTGGKALGYSNAAAFMQHFLNGTGETYNLDVADFLSSDSGALSSRNDAIENALRAAEALAREGETLTVNQLEENHPMQSSLAEKDWQYSLGSYFTDVDVLNLTVTEVNGVKTYSASIKYIVTDYYNWDQNDTNAFLGIGPSPYELYQLHLAGLAREFLTYGEITYDVTWTKGASVSDLGI